MKRSPQNQKLEEMLRSSKMVAGGFMGSEMRSAEEIIDADAADLSATGRTAQEVARRMSDITEAATAGLGTWIKVDSSREAMVEEAKGFLVCPWAHPGRYNKKVTTVRNTGSGATMRWSDLNIHLIWQHEFFEGRGSAWRLEPRELVEFIFDVRRSD